MRNNRFLTLSILVVLTFSFAGNSWAQKKIELKYNLNKGDSFSYDINMDNDISFEANGQTMTMDQSMTFELDQNISDVTADSIKLSGQITRVKMTQSIFGMQITYDSDDPSSTENPMAAKLGQELAKVLNKPFKMSMDHKGHLGDMEFSGIEGNDDIANNINSGSQYATYPDGKIAVGDSWESDIKPVSNSEMKYHVVYTLLKVSGKHAILGINGTITSNEVNGQEMRLDGTMKGEMTIDTKTGWLVKSTIDQEMEIDIEQNGVKFPATISGTIVTNSVKIN